MLYKYIINILIKKTFIQKKGYKINYTPFKTQTESSNLVI